MLLVGASGGRGRRTQGSPTPWTQKRGGVRLAALTAIAAMLVVSLATPGAFGTDGVIFGVA